MLTVGLLWHSMSSSNLGVGALTLSQMAIIERAATRLSKGVQFRLFGTQGEEDYGSFKKVVSTCGLERNFFVPWKSPFLKQIRQCDLVLDIGEGDSFTDIYGIERYFILTGTKFAVWLSGRPLVLSPQTIGPFRGALSRGGANFIMRRCNKVFARDHLSMEFLRGNGITNNDEVIDVAFALPFRRASVPDTGKLRIGINVSGLLYHGGYTRDNQFGLSLDYAALTHSILDWFCQREDCEVHLISHVVPESLEVENDHAVSMGLKTRYPNVHVAEKFASPSDAKSCIATMDFFIGARMHACIAAFSSGVPVFPLAYSRKFNGLFESLDYPHFGDCKQEGLNDVLEQIKNAFHDRDNLRTKVTAGNRVAQAKLVKYEDYLVDVMKAVHA